MNPAAAPYCFDEQMKTLGHNEPVASERPLVDGLADGRAEGVVAPHGERLQEMTESAGGSPHISRIRRLVFVAAVLSVTALSIWVAAVTLQIRKQSIVDEARKADVIVIMGAAEYRGKPSPVLKARLDHGLDLYRKGMASRILTTGGAGGDPVFTEGVVGRNYLMSHGVPPEAILLEGEGQSTMHSTTAVAEIMRRSGLTSCILVSDGYHIYRSKKMLEFRGLEVYGSPRSIKQAPGLPDWLLYLRQAAGYVLWSIGITI